ncbi:MAG: TIM barrel protein, partial [Actinomycetota bacterium]|nr:TIM barrel protein [Actinomycetota bacterium]
VSPAADRAGASWSRLITGLARVRDVAAARGVGIAVKFAPGTAVATCADAMRLATDVPGTGVLLDTRHARAGGEDPAECVRRLAHLLWHVHVGGEDDVGPLVVALDATYAGIVTVDMPAKAGTGAQAAAELLRALTR